MATNIIYDIKLNYDPHHQLVSLFMEIGPDILVQSSEDEKPVKPRTWIPKAAAKSVDLLVESIRINSLDVSKNLFPEGLIYKNKSPFNVGGLLKKVKKMEVENNTFSSFFDFTGFVAVNKDGEFTVEKKFTDNDIEVMRLLLAPYNNSRIHFSEQEFSGHGGIRSQIELKLVELNPKAAEIATIFADNITHRIIKNT
jgi:hypothetical protein